MLDMNVLAGMNKPDELKSEIIYYTTILEQPPAHRPHSTRLIYFSSALESILSNLCLGCSTHLPTITIPTTLLTILNILTIPSKLLQPHYPKTTINLAPLFCEGLTNKINLAI
jgi:hypothetical protein